MTRTLLAALVLLVIASACAQRNLPQRAQAFASLPDWTGLWESSAARLFLSPAGFLEGVDTQDEISKRVQLTGHPPLNDEWERKYQSAAHDTAAIQAAVLSAKSCATSFPLIMDWARVFQVAVTPEETLMVFESADVRHIYTDGRSHPQKDDLWPTPLGDSVGHWEGDTLVIDTVARTPGRIGMGSNDLSEQAHFVERMRRIDKNTLENQLTIDDPLRFTRPWQMTLRYSRVTDLDRMIAWDCSHDRNPVVDGELTIAPP